MKRINKAVALFLTIGCLITQVKAQTHYGLGAGISGEKHTFFGKDAGKFNLSFNNVFIGQEAGLSNTTGSENIFIGTYSGYKNISGKQNTFIGNAAGDANKTGSYNSMFGHNAGSSNITGEENAYFGNSAGGYNTSGSFNTCMGSSAGYYNLNGSNNSIVGALANAVGFGGNDNCIFGFKAGLFYEGNSNVVMGSEAGYNSKSGDQNTLIGFHAGYQNLSGQWNTFLGAESGLSSTVGAANAFLGTQAGYANTIGSNNAFVGFGAGYTNTTGDKNTYLGYASGGNASITNATAIGALAKVTTSNSLVLGNNANVGIGLSAPAYQLQLSTDLAAKAGSPDWKVMSDKRLKKDISDFTDGLTVLKNINPVWFSYNGAAGIKTGDKKFVGVIAQDMQRIAPYTIDHFNYQDSLGNSTQYLDYDANAVTYILINSVKEQQKAIETRNAEIEQLNKQVLDMKQRLEKLENLVKANATASPAHNLASARENAEEVVLEQNAPNPVTRSASIRFFIPQTVKSATLQVTSGEGRMIGSYPIGERGSGQFTFHANTLDSGVYTYHLITDGKISGARKLAITK
ncbi:tail fiber domain-containing protein [Dyadobacter psychrophilus]|uniref:Chaperone of endosialidase n=1 Tax=Dyadobacter psychrophilus TaxID=651661 RepID=A0A1T5DUB6_9BACT|nr:tail fiber domain-containing protein [Dyadobacter psychrophilus]SKB75156.1 Chaperone of endosialidase [Dyadobacter psychrophilus]